MLNALIVLLAILLGAGGQPGPSAVEADVVVASEDRDPAVNEAARAHPEPFVLPDQDALDAWRAALPASVAETFAEVAPRFPDEVAVVAHYGRCTEYSVLSHQGGGRLTYDVIDPEPTTMCAWSPIQLELYVVALADLGVDDPAQVTVART